jgi:hypothetical protein
MLKIVQTLMIDKYTMMIYSDAGDESAMSLSRIWTIHGATALMAEDIFPCLL